METNTLRLRWPFGQTLGLSLLLFGLLLGVSELFVRSEFVTSNLKAPGVGSRHRQFEIQLARLEKLTSEEGPVDCIVLGSSLVWLGFDPDSFAKAYESQTGEGIRCFNFGVATMPANGAGELAKILIEDYQPKLLIYGTSARDYTIPHKAEDAAVILETPWVEYRTGKHTIHGWLFTYSFLYRYGAYLPKLLEFDTDVLQNDLGTSFQELHGFLPKNDVAKPVNLAAAEKDARTWLFDYQITRDNLDGLDRLVSQQESNVQIIVIEMPVRYAYFENFGNGKQDYDQFVGQVDSLTSSRNIPFWRTTTQQLIPDEGWWDLSHLNAKGARIFSEWLGQQVGQAVIEGEISDPVKNSQGMKQHISAGQD